MKNIKEALIFGLVLFLLACGSSTESNVDIQLLHQKKDSLKEIHEKISAEIALIDEQLKTLDTNVSLPIVTTKPIEIKPFNHFVEIQGAVETGGNALVFPEAAGTIIAIVIKEGAKVNKGDAILKIDAGMLQSTVKEVETNYDLAKQIFEKQERLWKDNIGSEVNYLQAKTNKEALEQKLKTLHEQLDMYTVRAPFSGVVDEIMPKIGEAANPAMPVARVINYDERYIKADVSEDYITSIKEGTLVKVYFSSLDKEYEAEVERTGKYINPNNRTFKIQVSLNDIQESLQPNLLADIRVRDFYEEKAVVIPTNIIQQDRKGNEYVYLIDKQGVKTLVKKAIIKTTYSYNNETIVTSGLKGDEVLIDKGARSVQANDEVEVKTTL